MLVDETTRQIIRGVFRRNWWRIATNFHIIPPPTFPQTIRDTELVAICDLKKVADSLIIRGYRVMLDADLAELYGVSTFRLNEAVKRNSTRFPEDFMFQLTAGEYTSLISQIAISKAGRGGRRKMLYAGKDAAKD